MTIIDACLSGQMIGLKGVRPAQSFDIEVAGDLNAEGSVVLTSSSADEMAQESAELGGAVFTHHLVSGLYGAADEDGDLRISLRELYRYTYSRTVGSTARTVTGPQHPSYGFELEGKGDVILAMVGGPGALVYFPAGFAGDFFVLAEPTRELVAQVVQDGQKSRHLFLAPGLYHVLVRTGEELASTAVRVLEGKNLTLDPGGFQPTKASLTDVRGTDLATRGMLGFYALSGWFMPEMGVLHAAGILVRQRVGPLDVHARASYGLTRVNDNGFAYEWSGLDLAVAPLLCLPFHRFDLLAGPVLGAARLTQESPMIGTRNAWAVIPGLMLGADLRPFGDDTLLLIAWELDLYVMGRNGSWTAQPAPRATLGFGYSF